MVDHSMDEHWASFVQYAKEQAYTLSTAALVQAAGRRGIPAIRVNRNLVQLGHEPDQKYINGTLTSETRRSAIELAANKNATNRLLTSLGIPVAKQRVAETLDDALRIAGEVGFPVVIKPLNSNHGNAVSVGLTTRRQVQPAFDKARQYGSTVLVEGYIPGWSHRMLVVDNRLVAAAKLIPGRVMGDGAHTVRELVDLANSDPRRGKGHENALTLLELDGLAEEILKERGYMPETVPPSGELVYLRATSNLSVGGTASDVTEDVHQENREMAACAVLAIGLNVAGIDFITTDISKSYRETGGAICEVNASPGLRMHLAPSEGKGRDVAGPIIDMLFPASVPDRISSLLAPEAESFLTSRFSRSGT